MLRKEKKRITNKQITFYLNMMGELDDKRFDHKSYMVYLAFS